MLTRSVAMENLADVASLLEVESEKGKNPDVIDRKSATVTVKWHSQGHSSEQALKEQTLKEEKVKEQVKEQQPLEQHEKEPAGKKEGKILCE